jgi:hypothetical protein|tara:strand:- start:920 stop:1156 length:237 start_codon:yes stop_codon:yes gene_type:complete
MTIREMITDYEQKILDKCGFNKDRLTDEQIEIIFQPEWGPENFYQDGEISPAEADRLWVQKLKCNRVYHKNLVKHMLG